MKNQIALMIAVVVLVVIAVLLIITPPLVSATPEQTEDIQASVATEMAVADDAAADNSDGLADSDVVTGLSDRFSDMKAESPEVLADLQDKSKALAEKARERGSEFAQSDMVAGVSGVFSGIAERVETQKDKAEGLNLNRFFKNDDKLTVTGLGSNVSVERDTMVVDGIRRTRIIIEMDGGDNVEIKLPDAPLTPETP